MRIIPQVRTATLAVLGLLGLIAVVGCSSQPSAPDRDQEWLTLDQYKKRIASDPTPLLAPVVSVPGGAVVELCVSLKKQSESAIFVENWDSLMHDALEPVDDQTVVRLRAKKAVYLDLEHMLVSTDKKEWMPLNFHFFPLFRESRLSVKAGGENPDVVVPVSTSFERISLVREFFGKLR